MTPEERSVVKEKLREIAAILYQDTSSENLETFETIELTVRKHLLETVAPEIGNFFNDSAGGSRAGRKRKVTTCADASRPSRLTTICAYALRQIDISSKQAVRLKLKKGKRVSPHLEKCCLLLVANESFANAAKDIEILTGFKIPHSTQHRLVNNYQLPEAKVTKKAKSLSVDGGTIRLRTSLGNKSEWKNYKAVKIHERLGVAFFQNKQGLLDWVNQQSLSRSVSCLGDGHDGVWNIIEQIGTNEQRREILDWYHLMENLHKVGGSIRRLKRVENYLWHGFVDDAISEFNQLTKKAARNFQNYLRKHRFRIPDYQLYQELGICIGSGSVESWIKQIASRVKIVGAQWNPKNVSQILRLRCAYLNSKISLSISA
ncbi:MAG: ISKra4 family transposase [Cyanobacteria bacterium J06643_13]